MRDRLETMEFLRANPSVLDVFPVEAHAAARHIERKGMHHVHRRVVSRVNGTPGGSEGEASQTSFLPDLLDRAGLGILASLQVSGDRRPMTAEASDRLASAHDQDATSIPKDHTDDGRRPDTGEFHCTAIALKDKRVARPHTTRV